MNCPEITRSNALLSLVTMIATRAGVSMNQGWGRELAYTKTHLHYIPDLGPTIQVRAWTQSKQLK